MTENNSYRGKALVVGNDHYDQVKPDLDNAVNDAKSIYEAFRELGFMMMPEAYDIDTDKFDELFYWCPLKVFPCAHACEDLKRKG